MDIIPEPLEFEWDEGNVDKNREKHLVSFKETEQIFINEPKSILDDRKHSKKEKRYMLWGITDEGRKLTVIFTIRGKKVRVISVRDMSRKEEKSYEKTA
ncbi:hypothetical protein A3F03_00840 [Candidatus Roizmanbacteria bacterium RIFCSPHIGHO2_12_FULL_41_11]|uniref:BrnT family toxin n=1 Tax=Candidatus Roizmanbacteria bacterium RIFCSPHIGHO2_12_FULL_41_11 TaxID=1802052 RepID=A0A1F7I3Q6_9BACT|nr:MAG: hypothetical protein A3F03_00840 [Candidatus Roizmanbacteria bacterium RIFCSPHIGHO2_12_FULL_41_11]